MRYLLAALAVFGLELGVPAVAWAQSPPPCAAYDTCQYMPNPYYDGPLLPTWNAPGTYGGWTTLPGCATRSPIRARPTFRECGNDGTLHL